MCLGMWIFAFRIGCLHVWDLILVLVLVLGGGRINTFFFLGLVCNVLWDTGTYSW